MTCNRYQYQLSLHLDGRLSSARRDSLMQHLADCSSCQSLWQEMQSAQDLALSLPSQPVSPDFKDSLLTRIRSGEGTPEAVFHEPVPKLVKLRYLASGAAAAAVIIFGLSWYDNLEGGDLQGNGMGLTRIDPSDSTSVARAGAWDPESLGIHSFIPVNVAEAGARSVTDSARDLQYQTADLNSRVDHMSPRQLLREDEKFAGTMARARGSVGLMRWMQEVKIVYLPTRFDSELRLYEASLNRLQSAESPDEFRFALEGINRLQIEHMRDNFQVICCQKPEEFFGRFSSVVSRNPDISRVLQVQVLESRDSKMLTGPGGTKRIVIRFRVPRGTLEMKGDRK